MNKQNNMLLTKKVLEYQKSGTGFTGLQKELALRAYYYPKYKFKWNLDLCGDFLLFFYPTIIRTIHSYKHQERSFDHYFNSTLYWQLFAFVRKQKRINCEWRYATQSHFWDLPWIENVDYKEEKPLNLKNALEFDKHNRIKKESEKKQLLFFTLKKSRTMTTKNIQYLTAVTGYKTEWLSALVEKLKLTMQDKEKRFNIYACRRKVAFAKILLLGRNLENECCPERRVQLKNKINKLHDIYNNACDRISRIHMIPTQESIALVTGYPKGTVDCAIFTLKEKIIRTISVYLN